jgi:hypothetical protein
MQKLQISQKQIACCSLNLKLYRVPEQENQNPTMNKEVQSQWKQEINQRSHSTLQTKRKQAWKPNPSKKQTQFKDT